MSHLDDLAADDLAFHRALVTAELFLLLEREAAAGEVVPRVFELESGPMVLAFDSEERLAGFAGAVAAYAALPGRVMAAQLAGQGVALGLNLGSGAASERVLPPQALDWIVAMLDQRIPEPLEARVAGFLAPVVPEGVTAALAAALPGVERGYLVGVRYQGGGAGQLLALVGVAPSAEVKMARAVTEALAFSGIEAGMLDIAFVAAGDALLDRMAGVALVFDGLAPTVPEPVAPNAPGMDPARPPILR